MKGFAMTLFVIVFISSLVYFFLILQTEHRKLENAITEPQQLAHSTYLFDAVAGDFNTILGPVRSITRDDNGTFVVFSDSVPKDSFSTTLDSYRNAFEINVSNQSHITASLNISNMSNTSGNGSGNSPFNVFINRQYNYSNPVNTGGNGSMFFVSGAGGATNASFYEINLTVVKNRLSLVSPVTGAGDINITIRYTDNNGTIIVTGPVSSLASNLLSVTYTDGSSLMVLIGLSGLINTGALAITTTNTTATTNWSVHLPVPSAQTRVGYEYDATLDYSQSNTRIIRRLGK